MNEWKKKMAFMSGSARAFTCETLTPNPSSVTKKKGVKKRFHHKTLLVGGAAEYLLFQFQQ